MLASEKPCDRTAITAQDSDFTSVLIHNSHMFVFSYISICLAPKAAPPSPEFACFLPVWLMPFPTKISWDFPPSFRKSRFMWIIFPHGLSHSHPQMESKMRSSASLTIVVGVLLIMAPAQSDMLEKWPSILAQVRHKWLSFLGVSEKRRTWYDNRCVADGENVLVEVRYVQYENLNIALQWWESFILHFAFLIFAFFSHRDVMKQPV